MPISTHEARIIFSTVESVGGTVPPELHALANLDTRVREAVPAKTTPLDNLESVAAMSDTALSKALHDSAMSLALDVARQDLLKRLDVQIPIAISTALSGAAGDALFKSLRSVVNKHAEALDKVADALPEEVAADQAINLGDKAAAAWRDGPAHAQALDTILWQIVRPIATDVITHDPTVFNNGQARFFGFFVDLESGVSLDEVAARFNTAHQVKRSRFGGWRALRGTSPIVLNSPSTVQAHLIGLSETARTNAHERYAPRPAAETDGSHFVSF